MNNNSISDKIINVVKWKIVELIFLQVVNAGIPIVLARILSPEHFGTIAILSIFISLANTFVNNGLGNAIIQKHNSDEEDCSTVFFAQLFISVICYLVLFVIAPIISKIYNNIELINMIRIMSIIIVIGAFNTMQIVILKKNMDFYKSFITNALSIVSYGGVGVFFALKGFECWSLIFANIAKEIVLFICLSFTVRWKPRLKFSFEKLKKLFGFSWKLTIGWIIGTLHNDIYTLVIGKYFNNSILGYYNRASSFPNIILKTSTDVVENVMFPALSQIQHSKEKIKEVSRIFLSIVSYIAFPCFIGMAVASKNIIHVILTEKWLPSSSMMSIICITYSFSALNNANMQIFNSIGRSDVFMKIEIIKRSVSLLLLMLMTKTNIHAVTLILLYVTMLSALVNCYQNKKLLGYTYKQQIIDIFPSLLISLLMGSVVYFVGFLKYHVGIVLALQIIVGIGIYLIESYIFKIRSFYLLIEMIKNKIKK